MEISESWKNSYPGAVVAPQAATESPETHTAE